MTIAADEFLCQHRSQPTPAVCPHVGPDKRAHIQLQSYAPIMEGNLAVFPAVSNVSHETGMFLTSDDGIRSGEVIVREAGEPNGFVRPRLMPHVIPQTSQNPPIAQNDGVCRERPYRVPRSDGAQVNELVIINSSDKPLLLLAGEIVTGGKQDRIGSTKHTSKGNGGTQPGRSLE